MSFFDKHQEPYEERVTAWQAIQDAKTLEEQLEDARTACYKAVDDLIRESRNAPHTTLKIETLRGRALYGIIHATNTLTRWRYFSLLNSLPPVATPAKTYYDYLHDGVQHMADTVDKIVFNQVSECTKP